MSRPLPPFSPDPSLAARARELAVQHGVTRAAALLGVSAEALARLAAGLGVRRGTALLAERALADLNPPPRAA